MPRTTTDNIPRGNRSGSQAGFYAMPVRPRDPAARTAGALLLLTALATAAAVAGRVAADADQHTLVDSLTAISESKGLYGIGGAARLLSGITLIASAWFLLATWIMRLRLGAPAVPVLLAVSGLFTAVSGGAAVWLALSVPDSASAISTLCAVRFDRAGVGRQMAHRQDRLRRGGACPDRRGAPPVEGRRRVETHRAILGDHRHSDAVHLDRLGHLHAPDQRHGVLPLARSHWDLAHDGTSGTTFFRHARFAPRNPAHKVKLNINTFRRTLCSARNYRTP